MISSFPDQVCLNGQNMRFAHKNFSAQLSNLI